MGAVKALVSVHKIFVIPSFEGWRFYELVMDDGGGVITEWMDRNLDEEDQAVIDALLLNFRSSQQWDDLWQETRFESFGTIFQIPLPYGRGGYRIYGTRKNIYEFVMLLMAKGNPTNRLLSKDKELLESRIADLQAHPEKCREYQFD